MSMKEPEVNCPQCGTIVVWRAASVYRPFCSERCKLIDLGQWATESYRLPDDGNNTGQAPEGTVDDGK